MSEDTKKQELETPPKEEKKFYFTNPEGERVEIIPLCLCSPGNLFIHATDKNGREYLIETGRVKYE